MRDLMDALVTGTRDYARKCGFSSVSSAERRIDSAVTACVAARALGPDRVHGVSCPRSTRTREPGRRPLPRCRPRDPISGDPITPVFSEYLRLLAEPSPASPGHRRGELAGPHSGNILMALSNKFGHLVLSTGNKSELAVGYCTLYGDMAGGLAVISDVPKTVVYQLAAHINPGRDGHPGEHDPPGADRRAQARQTDQDSCPRTSCSTASCGCGSRST